jgi:hypothetical protein
MPASIFSQKVVSLACIEEVSVRNPTGTLSAITMAFRDIP